MPVEHIVLTTHAYEHKIFVPPFQRCYGTAQVWVVPRRAAGACACSAEPNVSLICMQKCHASVSACLRLARWPALQLHETPLTPSGLVEFACLACTASHARVGKATRNPLFEYRVDV